MFIDKECGDLIVDNEVKNLLEILAKKSQRFYNFTIDVHSVTNVVGESISSVTSGIFIGNQLGKHGFSCDFFTTK